MSRSLTSKLFRIARLSADVRSIERGTEIHRAENIGKGRLLAKGGFWRALYGRGKR
jgi:hypothetical protein